MDKDEDIVEIATALPDLTQMSLAELARTQDPVVLKALDKVWEDAAAPPEVNLHFYDQ